MPFIPDIRYFRIGDCFLLFSQITCHTVMDSEILDPGSSFLTPILFMTNIRHGILGDLKIRRSQILFIPKSGN